MLEAQSGKLKGRCRLTVLGCQWAVENPPTVKSVSESPVGQNSGLCSSSFRTSRRTRRASLTASFASESVTGS